MKTTKLTPIGNRLILELDPALAVSAGGIAIPDRAQKTTEWGRVIGAGPHCKDLIIGDRVFIPSHMGAHYTEAGAHFILIEEPKVLCRELRVSDAFSAGDSVRLNSGGPRMEVVAVQGNDLKVTWDQGREEDLFHASMCCKVPANLAGETNPAPNRPPITFSAKV